MNGQPYQNLYGEGVEVPETTKIGAYVDIGSKLGRFSKVQTGVSIPPGWKLGDHVFYGPGARFANDKNPTLGEDFTPQGGKVENNVVIGMGALIGAEVTLGHDCIVGMGAVVTKDVAPGTIVVGNPARPL